MALFFLMIMMVVVPCRTTLLENSESDWEADKRAQRFYAWGGKRSMVLPRERLRTLIKLYKEIVTSNDDVNLDPVQLSKKQKFYSWGGKRTLSVDEKETVDIDGNPEDKIPMLDKRRFQPWGGK